MKDSVTITIAGGNIRPIDAIKDFFNNHFFPPFEKIDSTRFLEEELFCEECDKVFKKYEDILRDIYHKYGTAVGFSLNAPR